MEQVVTKKAMDLGFTTPIGLSVTTAMDRHKERNTNESVYQDLLRKIKESGVEFIYYAMITLSGRVVTKAVPAKHLLRNLEKGVQLHRTALSDLQAGRNGVLLGGGIQSPEITAIPDVDSFKVLPWDRNMGMFFCTIYEPEYRPEIGGSLFYADVRSRLQHAHREFEQKTGLVLKSGCEPEMSWIGDQIEVKARPGASPAYHFGSFEVMRSIYKQVMRYAEELGFDMIESDYEDPTQLEMNWMFDRCELTADRLLLYRLLCKQVAREHNVIASFMPKPYTSSMGNGCHHNLSLWRGNENILMEAGRRDIHLTDAGRHMVGGLLKHSAGAMPILASTVNSYKRYWDVGLFAPSVLNWGMDNRSCTIRLSGNGRLEYKIPDASVNPYLSHTVILKAIEDGLQNRIDPGEADVDDCINPGDKILLPATLGDAIREFESNSIVQSALPNGLSDLYLALKKEEWARACSAVTNWEFDMYLEYLP